MGINVLSLFDGMSCGQIALERAGIKVNNYFSSEIDKYAIKITQKNYPNTVQLGDVTKIKGTDLPPIDLLLGGSPCQGFSFAGKGLNFDDPRSALFFEYVRLLKECNPDYFLLENVKMKKEHELVITKYLDVWPIEINSALVSAQNRHRLYWTNIKAEPFTLFGNLRTTIKQPEDKGILLKDIIESGAVDRNKSYCIDANYFKGGSLKNYTEKARRKMVFCNDKNTERFFNKKQGSRSWELTISQLCTMFDKANCLTTSGQRISNNGSTNIIYKTEQGIKIRPLTALECERLQTVPDNYTEGVSKTQRYRMLGNGWTVDVISHILGHLTGFQVDITIVGMGHV